MSESDTSNSAELVRFTAEIVSAYVGNNSVHVSDLPNVIAVIHSALQGLGQPQVPAAEEKRVPPVSIRKSVTDEFLISMEDGKRYKSLKRHLSGRGLTPEQYREKWGLPRDYPMVAPSYAARRSELAKAAGLGLQRKKPAEQAPKRSGRRKAA